MYKIGASLDRFGPKKEGHPSVGEECPACKKSLKVGDYTTLITLGPGDNQEEQEKAENGRSYNAVAIEVHWTCATGKTIDKEKKKTSDMDSLMWWGYKHINGTVQVKRYFGIEDIKEAAESDFVEDCYGPFKCNERKAALEELERRIRSNPLI